MIGSFWNLCRACPSMPVDKLHSEYRSTYRWHEFTGNSRPEVVRRAPAPNPSQFVGPTNEPPLPRRKKCPELAYKSHEFIIGSEYTDARRDASAHRSARSEERGTPSRRSKSEGPPVVSNGRAYPAATEIDGTTSKQAGESNGLFKKTITKLSTEYRLQFVWPNVRRIKGADSNVTTTARAAAGDYPRKSISLGAIRSGQPGQPTHSHTHQYQTMGAGLPTVHKKRTTNQKEATLHELEPLVSDTDDRKTHEKQVNFVERKIATRPFSQTIDQERLNHFITKKENFGFAAAAAAKDAKDDNRQQPSTAAADVTDQGQVVVMNGTAPPHSKPNLDLWFKEMVELRKKAGEYKCRGWGIEIDPELYKKQKDLWDQVSKRSSLSALSLASTVHRPITKEEKEQENNKKSTPLEKTIPQKPRVPGQAYLIDNKDEISALPARFNNIRHHLERTTGPDVEEGALLPSPTREKLMPAITKRESESQRGSPKKTALSRHGSPQKGSPQKGSPKKVLKTRSQSVGPGVENESPKRQIRSASQAPTSRKKAPTAPSATSAGTERKPRPSTLSTTFQSRIKSSSLPPPIGKVAAAPTAAAAAAEATAAATAAATSARATASSNANHANQSHVSLCKSYNNKNNNYGNKINKSSSSSQQQQQQQQQQKQQQQQMRKKDKDRSNISCIGIGSQVGAGSGNGSSANSAKHQQNKQKQQQLQQQQQRKQQQQQLQQVQAQQQHQPQQQQLSSDMAATSASTSVPSATSSTAPTRPATINIKRLTVPGQDRKLAENDSEDGRETAISISSCSPQPVPEVPDEPLVKSPPEPTRVKSPEQIIMRSPDPVNWTVPLDTGKTFTVTQNVKEGESYSRPQSEIKASTPVEKPPPPPQSAPPQLTEQAKMDAWKSSSPTTSAAAYGKTLTPIQQPGGAVRCDANKPGPEQAMSSSSSTATASTARSTAADVLEKARDRFDRFWGGTSNASKEESV
ncbi:LOW QUALITY PROTEIN: serine/arginine repetitive matrix protein 1 [Drosophila sulfurigaster albostrigata]|uniref:LOW QUALITY PROTEIN: serine/arginine repetitive matrix protein 1 n=1 Tax=Drosophila sulfurigaster albostrigata TaxID=89887 RepID=UPI002D21A63C|nr:LOW QUALITY PROTEIN: serine/arginine repetitive matrix protein 1 [Drosophila sulfurigaster albostrigata]